MRGASSFSRASPASGRPVSGLQATQVESLAGPSVLEVNGLLDFSELQRTSLRTRGIIEARTPLTSPLMLPTARITGQLLSNPPPVDTAPSAAHPPGF